ncbi:MAG: 50S ribosomal protein L21 [Alphaproteobacteria bacterium]|nr:50S ribosomal protein L21 [Alphaproteobacteria bacterium]
MNVAIIVASGKQFLVAEGDVISLDMKKNTTKVGETITFDKVLFDSTGAVGAPYLSGKKVTGVVKTIGRAKKIEGLVYKAKSDFMRRFGHRQPFVKIEITKI